MPVVVDAEELILALEDHSEVECYLDLSTGEVVPLVDPGISGDSTVQDEVDENPERYRRVVPTPSHRTFSIMEDFVDELPPGSEANELSAALERRHSFRSFRDALARYPATRESWFQFHAQRMWTMAREWLADAALELVLAPLPMRDERT